MNYFHEIESFLPLAIEGRVIYCMPVLCKLKALALFNTFNAIVSVWNYRWLHVLIHHPVIIIQYYN